MPGSDLLRGLMAALLLGAPTGGVAQAPNEYPVADDRQLVASLNRDRLLSDSTYGRALMEELGKRQASLVAENESLLAELEREELALTETRKTMSPEDFAPLADAFDRKVNAIRAGQDQKALDLAKALEGTRFSFFREVEPIIIAVMQERGITFLLNEQAVMLSTGDGDITDAVLERLNALHADGQLGTRP